MKSVLAGLAATIGLSAMSPALAQSTEAKNFGAREAVEQIALSPDGTKVVFLAPGTGKATVAYVADVDGSKPSAIATSSGNGENLKECHWASVNRLVCQVYIQNLSNLSIDTTAIVEYTRMIAVDADGKNLKMLSAQLRDQAFGVAQSGGEVIDWLPEADGSVLMTRVYVPEVSTSTHLGNVDEGFGVERVDTRTLQRSPVEPGNKDAGDFLTDGHGAVRIMERSESKDDNLTGKLRYDYRIAGQRSWKPLSEYNEKTRTGFLPLAVDRELNAVYGLDKLDGRDALYRISLDGALTRTLVFQHPNVDVAGLVEVGRQQRVVGVTWVTDKREAAYFDPAIKALADSLSKALPGLPLVEIVDFSLDENRLLILAGSDIDPGHYYVFDRKAHRLNEIMLVRPELENARLAEVKPITFKAADGTEIPAYLTLPPGGTGKNLPAIVMPHGGPSMRDEWGFEWLVQFFAARGYAVLQPNYRGSAGYGDGWYAKNGFKSWKTAIGDVNDGGRWLVSQGIAAPDKLAIVGWSYGGYAALQSAVLDPHLFKAVVAVAPVTDLATLKQESLDFTNHFLAEDEIGSGPQITEGSPAQNAQAILAPVLLFHGDRDQNVGVAESRLMATKLQAAHKQVELVIFPGLDHRLNDSEARTQMLDKADGFLRKSLGMQP